MKTLTKTLTVDFTFQERFIMNGICSGEKDIPKLTRQLNIPMQEGYALVEKANYKTELGHKYFDRDWDVYFNIQDNDKSWHKISLRELENGV